MRKSIVIVYCNQKGMAHNADEAKSLIETFTSYGRKNDARLVVSERLNAYLTELFDNDAPLKPWRTQNCGCKDIVFYEALADTFEEHQQLYFARCEAEKKERLRVAEEARQRFKEYASRQRHGWYGYRIEATTQDPLKGFRNRFMEFTDKVIADSVFDAYNKVVKQIQDFCDERGLMYLGADEPDYQNVVFLGVRTEDGGWSALEEAQEEEEML